MSARMHLLSCLIFSHLVFDASAFADRVIAGIVVQVVDGNTLEVFAADDNNYTIVLYGIDCPELTQDFGPEAKALLERLLLNSEVSVTLHGKDRHGNYRGTVMKGEVDIRVPMLEAGLAWTAEKDPLPALEAVRDDAARQRAGLWATEAPVPPWQYRRQQSMLTPKSR